VKPVEHIPRIGNISKITTTKDEERKNRIEDAGVMLVHVKL
jgi:hypothetical protein